MEGTPTLYDAFICYNAEGDDLEFVKLLIHKLEDEYGMKLFVPERDDLPGSSASTTCAKLIQQRYTCINLFTLWAESADDKLMKFFLFFLENKL